MAKIKIEKSLYLRIIINREEENEDEFLTKCTNFWVQFFNLHDDKIFNTHHGYTDDSFWFDLYCPPDKEQKLKDLIKKRAKEFDVKVELEEKKEEKWRPVHEIAIERLKKWPVPELSTIAGIYENGADVPPKDIPALIDALVYALNKPGVDTWTETITKKAIKNLKQQQKEKKEE